MPTTEPRTPTPSRTATSGDLYEAIRSYVRTYVLWHGRAKAAGDLRRLPSHPVAVPATWPTGTVPAQGRHEGLGPHPGGLLKQLPRRSPPATAPSPGPSTSSPRLPRALEDTLLLLCATPLATVGELALLSRVPGTTLRDRLAKLGEQGLTDSVVHHLSVLGPPLRRRHFPTALGVDAGAKAEHGRQRFLKEYPVSRECLRLLGERLDATAVLYHVAGLLASTDPQKRPVRVDHYRRGPYDAVINLSGGPLGGIAAPGAHPAVGQPALPGEDTGEASLRPETQDHPDTDPLRAGHSPCLPHPRQRDGPPHHLRDHPGGTAGGRRPVPSLAAVWHRHQHRPACYDRPRPQPDRHPHLGPLAGGGQRRVATPARRRARRPAIPGPRRAVSLRPAGNHA